MKKYAIYLISDLSKMKLDFVQDFNSRKAAEREMLKLRGGSSDYLICEQSAIMEREHHLLENIHEKYKSTLMTF